MLGRGSTYTVPEDATGDARVYGVFTSQTILGYSCTITVEPLDDGDPQVADMLGAGGVWSRGGTAIHISGRDPFGRQTGPGFVRALGLYSVDWLGRTDVPAGLGCRRPEPAAIVSWDEDAGGRGHRDQRWQHHTFYGGADYYVTLAGVAEWWRTYHERREFRPVDLCRRIDTIHGWDERNSLGCLHHMAIQNDQQHLRAVRRLLEGCVGVERNRRLVGGLLGRRGRWGYGFEEAE